MGKLEEKIADILDRFDEEFDIDTDEEHILAYSAGDIKSFLRQELLSYRREIEEKGFLQGFKDCKEMIREGKHNHCCFQKEVDSLLKLKTNQDK